MFIGSIDPCALMLAPPALVAQALCPLSSHNGHGSRDPRLQSHLPHRPAIRTLLDTDFYKLLMLQMIWQMHPKRQVTFQLINRTTSVRLADIVDERELTDQLDHARTLSGLPRTS